MEKNGFFPFEKRTLIFIFIAVAFAIFQFTPFMYDSRTETGTTFQFICTNIILCGVPMFSLIDGYFRAKKK